MMDTEPDSRGGSEAGGRPFGFGPCPHHCGGIDKSLLNRVGLA